MGVFARAHSQVKNTRWRCSIITKLLSKKMSGNLPMRLFCSIWRSHGPKKIETYQRKSAISHLINPNGARVLLPELIPDTKKLPYPEKEKETEREKESKSLIKNSCPVVKGPRGLARLNTAPLFFSVLAFWLQMVTWTQTTVSSTPFQLRDSERLKRY